MEVILMIVRKGGNFLDTECDQAFMKIKMPMAPFIGMHITVSKTHLEVSGISVNVDENIILVTLNVLHYKYGADKGRAYGNQLFDSIIKQDKRWDIGGKKIFAMPLKTV